MPPVIRLLTGHAGDESALGGLADCATSRDVSLSIRYAYDERYLSYSNGQVDGVITSAESSEDKQYQGAQSEFFARPYSLRAQPCF